MSLPQNSIGPLNFMALLGPVQTPGTELLVHGRLGVEGLQFTDSLRRGRPFTLLSRVDVPTRDFGLAYFDSDYQEAVRQGLLDLVQSDFNWTTLGLQIKVLRVELIGCYRCSVIVGGLTPGSTAILEANWELVMVRTPSSS
jgi:hypothetical protein